MSQADRVVIGTRASKLALWQSHHIRDRLLALQPGLEITLERISTRGDEIQDRPLAAIGRNSLFVAEIEDALRSGRIRLAVHSAKDLPSTIPSEFSIVAFTTRADARDVLVSKYGPLRDLPQGARIGTSSPRRNCQLKALRPDLVCLDIRGNVDTRLAKLERGEYDAIVLAAAGLDRLEWSHVITERLDPSVMLPAVAQGILAVEARSDDVEMARLCRALDDADARACATAERSFLAAMGAGCNAPLAGYATLNGDRLTLTALIGASDGRQVKVTREATRTDAATLGVAVAEELVGAGGAALLHAAGSAAANG